MPAPDTTILDLLLAYFDDSDPGGLAAAQAALEAGHPQAFADTVIAGVYVAQELRDATSSSSVSIGTGAKVFTLDDARVWKAGMPIFIVEDGDPTGNFMRGVLSADESAGVINVTIDATSGSGTFTGWTIFALFSVATVASPPLAVAGGGTGSTTKPGARSSLEVSFEVDVLSVDTTAPGGALIGDTHLVLDDVAQRDAFGPWLGHENEFAVSDGVGGWTFSVAVAGELVHDLETGEGWRWDGSVWNRRAGPAVLLSFNSSGTDTLDDGEFREDRIPIRAFSGSSAQTWTLPDPTGLRKGSTMIITHVGSAGVLTVNVAGGGLIDSVTSIALNPEESAWLTAGLAGVVKWHRLF